MRSIPTFAVALFAVACSSSPHLATAKLAKEETKRVEEELKRAKR